MVEYAEFVAYALFAFAGLIAYFFMSGFIWGAGYFPTPLSEIKKCANLMELESCKSFYDLGSGFGKVVLFIAKSNNAVSCVGVEIDPFKVWWSRLVIHSQRVSNARILRSNLLEVDLSNADVVFVYLSKGTEIMERLREKIFAEMKPGSRVVSYVHRFENWSPSIENGDLRLYRVSKPLTSN